MKKYFLFTMSASILIIAISIGYYFVIILPKNNSEKLSIEREKIELEKEKKENEEQKNIKVECEEKAKVRSEVHPDIKLLSYKVFQDECYGKYIISNNKYTVNVITNLTKDTHDIYVSPCEHASLFRSEDDKEECEIAKTYYEVTNDKVFLGE